MGKGPSQQVQQQQGEITSSELAIAQSQNQRANDLWKITLPGLETTENFYQALASGDPQKIQTATAPATQQIAQNYNQSEQAISAQMPRGGARDLALQESQISKEGAIGNVQAQSYLGAFPALANLAQGGIGLSVNEVTQALSALSGASSSNQAQGQMQSMGKAETLGFLGSLGQSAAQGAGMAIGCWIAEVIFGRNNAKTIRLRVWLNKIYRKTFIGRIVMWHYDVFGQAIARQVAKYSLVRKIVTPLFNYWDRQATAWEASWVPVLRKLGLI